MITLCSYPTLFGVADNNGYGLKVFSFMRLASAPHDLSEIHCLFFGSHRRRDVCA
jgi:hypothetical protein